MRLDGRGWRPILSFFNIGGKVNPNLAGTMASAKAQVIGLTSSLADICAVERSLEDCMLPQGQVRRRSTRGGKLMS